MSAFSSRHRGSKHERVLRFAFAFYMDRQIEERERGMATAWTTKKLYTEARHYTVIDAFRSSCVIKHLPGNPEKDHLSFATRRPVEVALHHL